MGSGKSYCVVTEEISESCDLVGKTKEVLGRIFDNCADHFLDEQVLGF